ncbi:MAG: DUF4292 domain-containing protein [Bacteroidota bacterium]
MNSLLKISIFIIFVAVLTGSCKSKKNQLPTAQDPLPKKSTKFLQKALDKNKVNAEWMSAKGKLNYRDDNEKVKATVFMRMRKDSVLWFVVKKAGVEAVRAQITTDSIYVINRRAKEYTIRGLDFFESDYNLPSSFAAIQSIILGNVLYLSNVKPDSEISDSQYRLFVEKDNVRAEYWMNGLTYQLSKMTFTDIRNDRIFDMTFDNYKQLDDQQNFSYFRNLNLSGKNMNAPDLDIKLSSVEINEPKSIKFDIPKRYKRVD